MWSEPRGVAFPETWVTQCQVREIFSSVDAHFISYLVWGALAFSIQRGRYMKRLREEFLLPASNPSLSIPHHPLCQIKI